MNSTFSEHNIFLLIAAEVGIIGSVIFLIFVINVFRCLLKYIKRVNEVESQIAIGLLAGLVSFLVICMVDPAYRFYPVLHILFWFLCGYAVSFNNLKSKIA